MLTKLTERKVYFHFIVLVLFLSSLTSCLTAKKLDKFVASEYNNELPKASKKKRADIDILPATSTNGAAISTTVHTTDQFLPLLVYWKYNHRQNCSLNPSIPLINFSNTVNTAGRGLSDKLNGKKLELTVEQAPGTFSIVSKEQLVWVIYAFGWAKVYVEPDPKDLVVSYKLMDSAVATKTGKIIVRNNIQNKGLRFFQSWRSASSEYLSEYNARLASMSKSFLTQLMQEL